MQKAEAGVEPHGVGDVAASYTSAFQKMLGKAFDRPVLIETDAHEGPVYVASEHALYFTTVPEPGPKNIAIKRVPLIGNTFKALGVETVRQPSNMANGMCFDREGRLVICEQGIMSERARVSRLTSQDP